MNKEVFLELIDKEKEVQIFADGACSGNPGPGGWGAVLQQNDLRIELYGGELDTTNNRMELTAAIESIKIFKEKQKILITTDSQYLKKGMESWINSWKRNNWKTSNKKMVKNRDLWEKLDELCTYHEASWAWVRGHTGVPENEKADALAKKAIIKLIVDGSL